MLSISMIGLGFECVSPQKKYHYYLKNFKNSIIIILKKEQFSIVKCLILQRIVSNTF